MNTLVAVALSLCLTSADPAGQKSHSTPRSPAELRTAVEQLITAEAAAKTSSDRVAALRSMTALANEIAAHPALGKHAAQSLRNRLAGRLKRAATELQPLANGTKRQIAAITLRPLDETVLAQQFGGGNLGGGLFDAPQASGAEGLADIIQDTIDPPSWEKNGGPGVIGFFARGGAGNGQLAQVPAGGNNFGGNNLGGPAQLDLSADASQELIDVIQQTIAPQTWDINGGEGVAIFFAPKGALIVRQTEEVHHGLVDVAAQLRQ